MADSTSNNEVAQVIEETRKVTEDETLDTNDYWAPVETDGRQMFWIPAPGTESGKILVSFRKLRAYLWREGYIIKRRSGFHTDYYDEDYYRSSRRENTDYNHYYYNRGGRHRGSGSINIYL